MSEAIYTEKIPGETDLCEVYPILLTLDILELNGFTAFPLSNNVIGLKNQNDISLIWDNCLKLTIFGVIIDIKYVHQLQNLLRIIGQNKLANSFKL